MTLAVDVQPRPLRPHKRDARVYVLVEEARLRCEALRAAAPPWEARHELQRLHRNLGLASEPHTAE